MSDKRALLFVGICTAFILGYMTQFITAWLVGALITDLDYSGTRAGFLVSLEYLSIAVAAMAVAPFADRVSVKSCAVAGGLLLLSANLAAMFVEGFGVLAITRVAAGIGSGLAMAMGSASLARMANPERAYAQVQIVGAIMGAVIMYSAGYAVTGFGYRGVFGLSVSLCLVGLALLLLLPRQAPPSSSGPATGLPRLFGAGGLVLLCMFVFMVSQGALWGFVERKGHAIAMNQEQLSAAFGIANIVGISGAVAATWANVRFGRVLPVLLGFSVYAVFLYLMFVTGLPSLFMLSFCVMQVLWFFCLPYIFGAAAAIDPHGGLAAAVTSTMLIGLAAGPAVGGLLFDYQGMVAIAWFSSVGTLASMVLLLAAIGRIEPQAGALATPMDSTG